MQIQNFLFTAVAIALLLSTNINAQSAATGTINGHDYVDLGISVKWATCNIGASSPSDYGDYFAWGEAETKSTYTKENSTTFGKTFFYTFLDAASAHWGSAWRMPTEDECRELIDNCTWQWTTVGGHNGYKVTSKKNGNSIFLPAAGDRLGPNLVSADEWGRYWSSSRLKGDSDFACGFGFDSGHRGVILNFRCYGRSIRPVSEK